jgi:TolB protein
MKKMLTLLILLLSITLYADVDIIADQEALPLVGISYTDTKTNEELKKSMNFYLNIVPYFKVLPDNLAQSIKDGEKIINIKFDKWRELKVEYLFKITVTENKDKLIVKVLIYSPVEEKKIWGKEYSEFKTNVHELAGFIANDVYSFFSAGKKGFFLTKIAFAQKVKGKKQILMMNIDGSKKQEITKNRAINMLPSWAKRNKILFTSYLRGNTDLYIRDLTSGKRMPISARSGLNTGGVLSPDGKTIALTLSKDGNSEIYLINSKTGKIEKRLTNNSALDTSPSWSPNGKQIAFVSNRGGNPHIYIMNSDGTDQKRITFQGTYNQTPQWSPNGDRLLFTARDERNKFDIFYIDLSDENKITRLTQDNGNNEEPSWSPDGEFIVFLSSRSGQYQVYIMDKDGKKTIQITNSKKRFYTPKWSPYN